MSPDLNLSNTNSIQRNYFCNWEVDLDPTAIYSISIERYSTDAEEIELVAKSDDKFYSYSNDQLQTEINIYKLVESSHLTIYARNKLESSSATFRVQISQTITESKNDLYWLTGAFGGIVMLVGVCLIVLLLCCVCVFLVALLIRCFYSGTEAIRDRINP